MPLAEGFCPTFLVYNLEVHGNESDIFLSQRKLNLLSILTF